MICTLWNVLIIIDNYLFIDCISGKKLAIFCPHTTNSVCQIFISIRFKYLIYISICVHSLLLETKPSDWQKKPTERRINDDEGEERHCVTICHLKSVLFLALTVYSIVVSLCARRARFIRFGLFLFEYFCHFYCGIVSRSAIQSHHTETYRGVKYDRNANTIHSIQFIHIYYKCTKRVYNTTTCFLFNWNDNNFVAFYVYFLSDFVCLFIFFSTMYMYFIRVYHE